MGLALGAAEGAISGVSPSMPAAVVPVGELVQGRAVCQSFRARYPNLTEVRVRLSADRPTGRLTLRLWEEGERSPTRAVTVELSSGRREWEQAFRFAPIAKAEGRWWRFCLEAPDSGAGHGVVVWATEEAGDEGELELRGFEGVGAPSGRILAFEARFSLSPFEKIMRLIQRLAAGKPGPWGEPWGYIGLFFAYGLLASLLCRWIHRRG
ncbi:hypothetical protein [Thermoflexus hugenholtzii]